MSCSSILRTAWVFAATVALAYSACAAVFAIWPGAAASFMNALFHGLDFGRLQTASTAFSFGGFLTALAGLTAWAFLFGAVFAWLSRVCARRDA